VTDASSITAIVDFADDIGGVVHRRRFGAPCAVLRASTLDEVVPVIEEADRFARAGRWVVGFVAYEAAPAFDPAFACGSGHPLPMAWFAVFDAPHGDHSALDDDRRRAFDCEEPSLDPVACMRNDDHAGAVRRIHEHISAGDVYQVNLTVPFSASLSSDPMALYERMRVAQGGRYACYLDIGEARILSASPELFFDRRGSLVRSRPMKGTAARGPYPSVDAAARDALVHSEKDRAENVMIVDVVRNDLGRVAEVGSVNVSALCEPERYPSVWQLTSTVEATVDPARPLTELFGALFPPASITGAPKIRATAIIRDLEAQPRGVYCGAIGVVRPGGDATFNVAIRTAWTGSASAILHLNAGGGITSDSTAEGELREVAAKVDAFTRCVAPSGLFETIRVEGGECVRLDRHLARMASSAAHLGIPFDGARALRTLEETLAATSTLDPVARARLDLGRTGALSAIVAPFRDHTEAGPLPVAVAREPVDAADMRLYHKTTDRRLYDSALDAAPGMFDVLLWNSDGLATELTRGNLVVELDGRRLTPPIECGLLPGTLRGELLERGEVLERILALDEVRRAQRLWFVNSLRGWVPIRITPVDAANRRA
jgi:para-aminobenzoate synthetase/4-amino-4-deoxychorismate lyase